MQTVSRTPIKKVFNTPNVSCRICDVNIKISGRFSCNIFQPNHSDFLKRFEVVLDDKVRDIVGVSQVLCQKCYRTVLKYEKVLEQHKEIIQFRKQCSIQFSTAVNVESSIREKRCAKDSPSTASLFRTRKKNCAPLRDSNKENTTKRKLISQDHNIADSQEYDNNPLLRLEPNIFDAKDPKPRSQTEVRFEKFS